MTNATLTIDVDQLATAIAAKVTAGDELARKLTREVLPIKFSDPADVIGSVRKLRDSWTSEAMRADRLEDEKTRATNAKVLAERDRNTLRGQFDRLSSQLIDVRSELRTVQDERDEFRRQLDAAQCELAKVAKPEDVPFAEGDRVQVVKHGPYVGADGDFQVGDVLTIREPKPDTDGDVKVESSRHVGDYDYAHKSTLRRLGNPAQLKVGDRVKVVGGFGHYLKVGTTATVVRAVGLSGRLDVEGESRMSGRTVRQGVQPADVRPLRTFQVGDTEPKGYRDSLVLTGEDENGRKVTLKWGRHSVLSDDGGELTWWNVNTADSMWTSKASWDYWLSKYGPLTEA
ncbi:hypothetical protein SEA_TINALIN_54 [Gordonia phage TinaLin]|uniref:Uncharacterized protein n=1 Tax=Gordonia phage TinaLin TaxID=2797324 RepID=A0A7T7GTF5_9CAUD|nr:hypothetical protein KDJ60_gp52 [Gordonia phage TinaLin]QQM15142.1 hypothetical protein SEA_TINALIN_54 [Gordonia phage TinaLin]